MHQSQIHPLESIIWSSILSSSTQTKIEKEKARVKIKKKKLKEFKKPRKMVKQVWHVKLVYDSKKGRKQHHDLVRELRIETIKEKPLTEDEIKQMAEENIDAIIEPLLAKGLPPDFTDIIVGLEEEEEIESEEESIKAELVEYYHKIPENLKRFLK